MKKFQDLELEGKTVLVHMSLDVPLHDGAVADDTRLRASKDTIQHCLDRNCKIVICGKIGRPKSQEQELSTLQLVPALEKILGVEVTLLVHEKEEAIASAPEKSVFLLENLLFDPRHKACDEGFAQELAALADVFVSDDYPSAHRAHATNTLIPELLPSGAGFAMQHEYDAIMKIVEHPESPFVAVIGGVKADKIGVVESMLGVADRIIVGGVLADTFLKASGVDVKGSRFDETSLEIAGEFLRDQEEKFLLPVDVVAAASFDEDAEHGAFALSEIPEGWMILDIGPKTRDAYREVLLGAKTIVWGGPIGVFEWEAFEKGTVAVAQALADSSAFTLVAGGDSGDAVHELGFAEKMSHVSIGGGATLALISGQELPAVEALR